MKASISFFIFFIFILAVSCHSGKEAASMTAAGKTYETDTAALTKAFANIPLNAEQSAGLRIFKMNCNKCHPGGNEGKGPSLKEKKPSEFIIHEQVRLGFGKMPHFPKSQISKDELQQLITFVRLLETTP